MAHCNFKTAPGITTTLSYIKSNGWRWHAHISGNDNIYVRSESSHKEFTVFLRKDRTLDVIKNKMKVKLRWIAIELL